MILEILGNLSLNKIQIIIRILDGFIMFFFISIFLTSVIINVKNRNLKSMLISLIFIIIYSLASAGTFFGLFMLDKLKIPVNNTSYYIEVGIFAVIQIAMIILIYIFADPFAREKKIEHMKETGEYDEILRRKKEKKENRLKNKQMKKKGQKNYRKEKIEKE